MKSIIKIRLEDGTLVNWDDLSMEEKKRIGEKLNEKSMVSAGFKKIIKEKTA